LGRRPSFSAYLTEIPPKAGPDALWFRTFFKNNRFWTSGWDPRESAGSPAASQGLHAGKRPFVVAGGSPAASRSAAGVTRETRPKPPVPLLCTAPHFPWFSAMPVNPVLRAMPVVPRASCDAGGPGAGGSACRRPAETRALPAGGRQNPCSRTTGLARSAGTTRYLLKPDNLWHRVRQCDTGARAAIRSYSSH